MLAGIPTALSISSAMEARNLRIQARDPVIELLSTSTIEALMNSIIYIVGLIVIVLAALSFFGLR
jgi:hypothetical protein